MTASSAYTALGSAEVEARIDADQQNIASAITALIAPETFIALVLIGGYARGEGGFELTVQGPQAYNDYDYFVVVNDLGRPALQQLRNQLAELAQVLEQSTGVEVDFFPLTRSQLQRLPATLMYAEMQAGHRVIAGDPAVLVQMPSMPLDRVQFAEFQRLMINRGSLLLLNQQMLNQSGIQPDSDLFNRYINKAVLAIGDSVLARHHRYVLSYRNKLERLAELNDPSAVAVLPLYRKAVSQKFEPQTSGFDLAALRQQQECAISLWIDEFNRLRPLVDQEAHATNIVSASRIRLRNLAVNLRDFGLITLIRHPTRALSYPRQRLIDSLAKLLQMKPHQQSQPLRSITAAPGADYDSLIAAYRRLWQRYS